MSRSTILSLVAAVLFGCGLPVSEAIPQDSSAPTYQRDIRPLFDKHCNGCHAPGGVGGLVLDGSPALTPLIPARSMLVSCLHGLRVRCPRPWSGRYRYQRRIWHRCMRGLRPARPRVAGVNTCRQPLRSGQQPT